MLLFRPAPRPLLAYLNVAFRGFAATQRHGTTILCVRRDSRVVLAGDGQVSQGSMCIKPNARKLRRIANGKVITGFAGSTADAFTLLERLEGKLEEHPDQLLRACVSLAKMWRTDRYLRNLEAVMIVADKDISLEVSGNGDVLQSHDGVIGIGSGGAYAVSAARALYEATDLSARSIAERAMKIAGDLCVYTNKNVIFEELASDTDDPQNGERDPKDRLRAPPEGTGVCGADASKSGDKACAPVGDCTVVGFPLPVEVTTKEQNPVVPRSIEPKTVYSEEENYQSRNPESANDSCTEQ